MAPQANTSDTPAATEELQKQYHYGDHEQDVNQVSGTRKGEHTQQPSDNQDHYQDIKNISHIKILKKCVLRNTKIKGRQDSIQVETIKRP